MGSGTDATRGLTAKTRRLHFAGLESPFKKGRSPMHVLRALIVLLGLAAMLTTTACLTATAMAAADNPSDQPVFPPR
jgi:hypothetical protein